MIRRCALLAVLAAAGTLLPAGGAAPLAAQVGKLAPVDEAPRDASFLAFRRQLQEVVRRRDAEALYGMLAENVETGFGGDGGVAAFKETWQPENPLSNLWNTLEEVLRMGGSFQGASRFVAPYVHSRWPERLDPTLHVAVVGTNVRVRESSELGSAVIAVLSYDLVPLARDRGGDRATQRWQVVQLGDGRRGYVARRYLRGPLDYRAVFEQRGGRWVLAALVAGD
ncbi:MAG TPA: SH3 domain-containing protein [Longimicrobiaceae bacterium]|nr:SH3 domain-containing protein [Longimicrobiaceae bacterium]